MKITVVADVYGQKNNGTSISAARLVAEMEKRGHEVKIVSPYKNEDKKYYTVPLRSFWVFDNYIKEKNGVILGKPVKETIWEAIKDADVVHLVLPFKMSKCAMKMCLEHNIPFTTAFHCPPEIIALQFGLLENKTVNKWIYKYFNKTFYKNVHFVHCPSQHIANKLVENGFKTENVIVSNGVVNDFVKNKDGVEKPAELKDKFCILFTGRYSLEKRHDLVVKAMKYSKYADKIQLIFAGQGPTRNKLVRLSKKLPVKPIFTFLSREDLLKTINYCDLYVHASDVEIEGMGCMEAISCGLVPVLSDSKNAAISQFALDDRNLFEHGNPKDLAKKFDYWYEHPEEREEQSEQYCDFMKAFKVDYCMDKMEKMFKDAIAYYKNTKK